MKFFDREDKIAALRKIREKSLSEAQFTVVTGRRRIGKTELVKRALGDRDFVYLFVSRKSETDLVADFVEEFNRVLPDSVSGEVRTLGGFFREMLKVAKTQAVTVFIDEFQDFYRVNPSAFSMLQGLWDRAHDGIRMNLVVCGSINTLVSKIFLDRKEPLYGRQTAFMRIEPFSVSVLKSILRHYKRDYLPEDLLALWAFTGGVAKYVALLMDAGALDFDTMLSVAVSEDSFFLEEGRILLGDEFGRDYAVYFSILSAIARGITTRNEIEQAVGRPVGGHLTRLEEDYHLVSKRIPFGAKTTRLVRYQIDDPFYRFWFRFIFKYDGLVQMKNFAMLRKFVKRDYPAFSGFALESFFRKKLEESGEWSHIGNWWDRKGESEIDLIAQNELDGSCRVFEIKRDRKRINLGVLKEKFSVCCAAIGLPRTANPEFIGLSMEDM